MCIKAAPTLPLRCPTLIQMRHLVRVLKFEFWYFSTHRQDRSGYAFLEASYIGNSTRNKFDLCVISYARYDLTPGVEGVHREEGVLSF